MLCHASLAVCHTPLTPLQSLSLYIEYSATVPSHCPSDFRGRMLVDIATNATRWELTHMG
jgi:hypothetical protein